MVVLPQMWWCEWYLLKSITAISIEKAGVLRIAVSLFGADAILSCGPYYYTLNFYEQEKGDGNHQIFGITVIRALDRNAKCRYCWKIGGNDQQITKCAQSSIILKLPTHKDQLLKEAQALSGEALSRSVFLSELLLCFLELFR